MNILLTLDSNYIYPLCALLRSLTKSDPGEDFDFYIIYSSLTEEDFIKMEKALSPLSFRIHRIKIDDSYFAAAPVLDRVSKATYYRLLAGEVLPESVEKVLYIDPDAIINRPLREFYDIDVSGCVLAGCRHLYGLWGLINTVRLGLGFKVRYINAGVLLINLKKWRETVSLNDIMAFINKYYRFLLLSDQDVVNVLFHGSIKLVDERLYNLDEKTYIRSSSRLRGKERINLDWVRKNTVVIHYNGQPKPWYEGKYRYYLKEFFDNNKDE